MTDDSRSDDAESRNPSEKEVAGSGPSPEGIFNPSPIDIRSFSLTILLLLAILYSLYFARDFFIPVVLALLLNFILRPILLLLKKLHISPLIGAALIIGGLVATIGAGAYYLSHPAADWFAKAPAAIHQIKSKLRPVQEPLKRVGKVAKEMEQIAKTEGEKESPEIRVKSPGIMLSVLTGTQHAVTAVVTIVILLYFLLVYQDLFMRKMVKVMPRFSEKKRVRVITRDIERLVSRYLLTVTAINIGLGAILGVAFYFIGLPNAILWGVMAIFLNYVPYLGATVGIIVVTIVGLFSFDTLGHAILSPAAYLVLASIEGSVVTPAVLGKRFLLNPAVIFIWLIFWGWIWGIPGAVLAVPMLTTLKIFCDNYAPLAGLGEFLGTDST